MSLLILASLVGIIHGDMHVVSQDDGNYNVVVNNENWLSSAATTLQVNGMHHSTADHTLKLVDEPKSGGGWDRMGEYSSMNYNYGIHSGPEQMHCHVRTYKDVPAVVMSQVRNQMF